MSDSLNLETLAVLRELDYPGKNDFITEIITTYISDNGDRFLALRASHQAGDAIGMGKSAHSIRGSSLNVGAEGLATLMQAIEKEGKAGILSAPERLAEAEALFNQVRAELKNFLG